MAPDALPVAANHAALSNRISMLLASQSSLLKTLNPPSSSRKTNAPKTKAAVDHAKTQAEIDDDELFKNSARPNEGVGYVPPKSGGSADQSKADKELRGRILGSRGAQLIAERQRLQLQKKKKKEESDDEEDVGRSALGKRKRPRREVVDEVEKEEGSKEEVNGEKEVESADVEMPTPETEEPVAAQTGTAKRKKNKKKNKTKA